MPHLHASNISARRTPLIGRAAEVAAVSDLLRTVDQRLVTLTGAGGSGKTELALESARGLSFHDGTWLIDLAVLTDERDLAQACCSVLSLSDAKRPAEELLSEFLAPRHVLLILDSCEHRLSAAAALADRLLNRCPDLRLLATSRTPLGIRGEQVLQVMPLAVPGEARWSTHELERSPAVELFLVRARALRPEITLEDDPRAIAEICAMLDGLPLAIELAAANVSAMSPAEIAERLRCDHLLLASRDQTRPERQRTMDAAISWSYDLLSPSEAAVFRRMAPFANGWTVAAVENVCALSGEERADVTRTVQRLVEHSLIVREGADESRFRWLEPLRGFAARKLYESGDEAAVRAAHESYYLKIAESLAPKRAGFAPPGHVRALVPDYGNIMRAFQSAQARGDVAVALRFHAALLEYWRITGELRIGLRSMRELLTAPLPAAARILVLLATADFSRLAADIELARSASREAHALALNEKGRFWLRYSLGMLRDVAAAERDFAAARRLSEEGLQLIKQDDGLALGWWHATQGIVEYEAGDWRVAREHLEQAERLLPESEPTWFRGQVLSRLGALARRDGDHPKAKRLLRRAIEWLAAYGARVELAEALVELAQVDATGKEPQLAVQLLSFADVLFESTGGSPSPAVRARRDALAHDLRRTLGPAEFSSAWVSARAWAPEEAEDLALGRRPVSLPRRASVLDTLTPREREVARLVAAGLTNPQIAQKLAISGGTARIHVERILQKLGVASRVQVATAIVGESGDAVVI